MRILPRQFGQVLNDALISLGRTWKPLATTSIIVFLPAGAITLGVFQLTGATEFLETVFGDPGYLETLPRDVFLELARPFLIACAVALVIQALATLFVYMVCHRVAVDDIQERPLDASGSRRNAMRRMGRAISGGAIAFVVVVGLITSGIIIWTFPLATVGTPNPTSLLIAAILLAALLAPGIWLAISFSMLTPVIAVEDKGVLDSLRRSRRLVKGRWWPTFGFLLFVGLLGSVATQLIQLVAIPLAAVGGVGTGLLLVSLLGLAAQGPIVAAMGAAYTHWYVDLRARLEPLLKDQL